MENERGIFILTVLKKMLDKLVYQDNFEDLDDGMSDSNIGSRKDRNIKNRLFKIYGVINYVVNGTEDPIDLEIYDQIKVFDALWLEDCLSDLYDTLPKENRNEKIALLYTSNVENLVAVNTAVGVTFFPFFLGRQLPTKKNTMFPLQTKEARIAMGCCVLNLVETDL